MAESKTVTEKIICRSGLNSNRNYLDLSDNYPGGAIVLQNFEPSLFGGYRRIDGYLPLEANFPEVDPTGAEGKILGIAIFNGTIIAARKQQSGDTYEFYFWTSGADWTKYTTGLTLSSDGVDKLRHAVFNFDGTRNIIFVDGVNNAILFDGTNWGQIDPGGTGVDLANAGGDQALEAPQYVTVFQNHIFLSGDPAFPQVVCHSAPNSAIDWTAASGGGQINASFEVQQIKPFRNTNYVFGSTKIRKITVSETTFLIEDVADDIGCVASDSVVEVNGDLVFLAQDGFRTIAGTERIGDVELGVISKNIQQDVTDLIITSPLTQVECVLIRRKSQLRLFFSDPQTEQADTHGIIAGLIASGDGVAWEWGRLRGIRASCVESGYIGTTEYVLHGDYNGRVYRQEVGTSFDGAPILAIYTTPYLDFGDTEIRKTFRTIHLFVRPEGAIELSGQIVYDWGSPYVLNPASYLFTLGADFPLYGLAEYGTDRYAGALAPMIFNDIQGSGRSISLRFTSEDTNPPYTVQALVFEITTDDRK